MLLEEIDPAATDPDGLRSRYRDDLASIVTDLGVEATAAQTDLSEDRVSALATGEPIEITLEEAASILALTEHWPDAESVLLEARDTLMLRMSNAVVDVDTLAVTMEGPLDSTGVQQRIEGRHPMTLTEYARVVHAIAEHGHE